MSALRLPFSVVDSVRARYRANRAGRLHAAAKAVVESLERRQLLSVTSATVTGPSQVSENTTATYVLSATDTIGNGTVWSQREPDGSYDGGFYIPEGQTYDFTYNAGDEGQDTLQFQVTDGGVCCGTGQSDSPYDTSPQNITITDAALGFETAVGGASAVEGDGSTSIVLGTLLDQDPNPSVPGDYAGSTVQWGDTNSSALQFVPTNVDAYGNAITQGSACLVEGTNAYAEDGPYTASLSIVDDGGQSASGSTPVTVTDAPISVSAQAPNAVVGQAFTGIVGTLNDQNPNGRSSDYTNSTIDWGDGTGVSTPTFQAVPNQPGTFNIIGSHTYANFGTFNMVPSVQDDNVAASDTATVYLPAPTISVGSVVVGVDQTLEVPVSLSGNNVADQSLTIASYDSSVIQAAWESGSTTDANGNANLLVTGVAFGQTDLVIAMANFANVQGDAVQQVQHNTITLSNDAITVCTHTGAAGGQSITATATFPNGQPAAGIFLEQQGFPNGPDSYSLSPFNGTTNAQGQWTFKVYGLQYNSDEPDDLQIDQLNDPGAFANAEVTVVVPQLTLSGPTAIDLGQQISIQVTAVDPTTGNPIQNLSLQVTLTQGDPTKPVARNDTGSLINTNANGTDFVLLTGTTNQLNLSAT